jgi:hypothetical protein
MRNFTKSQGGEEYLTLKKKEEERLTDLYSPFPHKIL